MCPYTTYRSPYGLLCAAAVHMRAHTLRAAAALLTGLGLALLLGGCATKPVVTAVNLTLQAASDLNPDARNRASPLTVRVYALKTVSAFQAADFFSLFEKDSATLAADIVLREELLLRPGESKTLQLSLPPDAKAIAVLAAYRDLERARWRDVRALEVGKPVNLRITLAARQAKIDLVP